MEKQKTIKKKFVIEGIGLHKGEKVKITFFPADVNTGIVFRNKKNEFKADVKYVIDTKRGTTLKYKDSVIYTVEHLLSAIKGMGIDNIILEIDGNEPPNMDGSAYPICLALKRVGFIYQNQNKKFFGIKNPYYIKDDDRFLIVLPYNKFKVYYFSDFSKYGIEKQHFVSEIKENIYLKEISKARTFGFKSEIDWLIKSNLIKGANLKNAILIDEGKVVNTKLRFKDELTRHKILDIVGDFGLISGNLKILIIGVKTGHKHNILLIKNLIKENNLVEV